MIQSENTGKIILDSEAIYIYIFEEHFQIQPIVMSHMV